MDRTPNKKAKIASVEKYRWSYEECPNCGCSKHKSAKKCFACHIKAKRPPIDNTVYLIDGVECRKIPLTRGYYATVDSADYEWLSRWNWSITTGSGGIMYASRHLVEDLKKCTTMHRQIMGLENSDIRVVDHIEPLNGLDNRRKNLRIATMLQNGQNKKLSSNNSLGLKGVSAKRGHFVARIRGKHIGYYDTKEEAHAAYCEAAKLAFGEFFRSG